MYGERERKGEGKGQPKYAPQKPVIPKSQLYQNIICYNLHFKKRERKKSTVRLLLLLYLLKRDRNKKNIVKRAMP